MGTPAESAPSTPQPFDQMLGIVANYWVSRAVYAGTALGLPDLVAAGPKTAAELAELTGSEPRSLSRLLRALTGVGLFRTDEQGRYATTPSATPCAPMCPVRWARWCSWNSATPTTRPGDGWWTPSASASQASTRRWDATSGSTSRPPRNSMPTSAGR